MSNKPIITLPLKTWKEIEEACLTEPLLEPDEHGYLGDGVLQGGLYDFGIVRRYMDLKLPLTL